MHEKQPRWGHGGRPAMETQRICRGESGLSRAKVLDRQREARIAESMLSGFVFGLAPNEDNSEEA